MDELAKGLAISLDGPARAAALRRCREQLARWQVSPPPAEPLVLDFGLGDFAQTGLIEYWIANETAAGYCGKYLFVFAGQSCPEHAHAEKHETFHVVQGRADFRLDGGKRTLAPGEVLPVAPGVRHGFTGSGPALLLELSSPCRIEDNRFSDPRIPIGGPPAKEGR
jgi:quercetin dioxygenase-like cupin family protein